MSLIAAYKTFNTPFLIGDLVLSVIADSEKPHFRLPTRDDLEDILPREWHRRITSTCQKVYIISDNFSVAWCDAYIAAKGIIRTLADQFRGAKPNLKEVAVFLASLTGFEAPNCTLVGWVIDKGEATAFMWESRNPKAFGTGQLFFEGSGSDRFRNSFSPQLSGGSHHPVQAALTLVGNLLGHEVVYGNSLQELFGGGFQMISASNGGFVHVPSTTFLFLPVKEEGTNILFAHHKRIVKYHFENNMLQILSLDVPKVGAVGKHTMHYVFPILASSTDVYSVQSNLSLRSAYYCIFVDVECKDNLRTQLVITVSDEKKDPLIKIIEGEGTMQGFALGETLYRTIVRALQNLDREELKKTARSFRP